MASQSIQMNSFSTVSSELDDQFPDCEDLRMLLRRERPGSFRVVKRDINYGKLGLPTEMDVEEDKKNCAQPEDETDCTTVYHVKLRSKKFRRFSQAASIRIKQRFSRVMSVRDAKPI